MVMDPVTRAILSSWNWRAELILVLLLALILYTAGWRRLRQKGSQQAHLGRLLVYWTAILLIALALMSPVDTLADQFFFMHMIQHLLLIMLVPPLLLLANPFPFALWGLPDGGRRRVGRGLSRLLHRESRFRSGLRQATAPGVVWILYVALLVGWHDPYAYDAALRNEFVHNLEHLSFFLPALAFWWLVIGAGPRIHKMLGKEARIFYVIAAIPPTMLLGVVLAFANTPAYTYYLSVPRPWGLTALQDQMLGGVIMWIPGSMMYIVAALILTARWLQRETRKPPLPLSEWATDSAMIAPGIEK